MTLSITLLRAKCCHAECHYAECRYADCHYAECHYAECHYAECRYADCHYAECHYAECRGAKDSKLACLSLQSLLPQFNGSQTSIKPLSFYVTEFITTIKNCARTIKSFIVQAQFWGFYSLCVLGLYYFVYSLKEFRLSKISNNLNNKNGIQGLYYKTFYGSIFAVS